MAGVWRGTFDGRATVLVIHANDSIVGASLQIGNTTKELKCSAAAYPEVRFEPLEPQGNYSGIWNGRVTDGKVFEGNYNNPRTNSTLVFKFEKQAEP
jgi:hypothetical protein